MEGAGRAEGIAPLPSRKMKGVEARIDMLVQLDSLWRAYAGLRDRRGLLQVAEQYRRAGLPKMAALVESEARML